jgi:hypothetical protein
MKAAETKHYNTMDFKSHLLNGDRVQALWCLYRAAGIEASCPLQPGVQQGQSHSRDAFVKERKNRCKSRQRTEREMRKKATKECYDNALLLTNGKAKDTTHYGLLGVTQNATRADIEKAFRKMARKFHPDRNTVSNLLHGSVERCGLPILEENELTHLFAVHFSRIRVMVSFLRN